MSDQETVTLAQWQLAKHHENELKRVSFIHTLTLGRDALIAVIACNFIGWLVFHSDLHAYGAATGIGAAFWAYLAQGHFTEPEKRDIGKIFQVASWGFGITAWLMFVSGVVR